jgi:hypothetical protein
MPAGRTDVAAGAGSAAAFSDKRLSSGFHLRIFRSKRLSRYGFGFLGARTGLKIASDPVREYKSRE